MFIAKFSSFLTLQIPDSRQGSVLALVIAFKIDHYFYFLLVGMGSKDRGDGGGAPRAAGHNPDKKSLSRSIKQMKFMSRSLNREDGSGSDGPERDTQWISHHGTQQRTVKIEGTSSVFRR